MATLRALILSLFLIQFKSNALEPTPNDLGITVFRISDAAELEKHQDQLGEIERLADYRYNKDSLPEAPFGTYLLVELEKAIGAMSIIQAGICAEVMTDILKAHQGKGLGTKLRQVVLAEISQKSRTTQFIQSLNEWDWGQNVESVRSALKCGFRIYSMFEFAGALYMFYPINSHTHTDEMWSQNRTDAFLSMSNIIRNPNKFDWQRNDIKQQLRDNFKTLLFSLNLSLRVDQQTFLVFCYRITTQFNIPSFDWQAMFSDILFNYINDHTLSSFYGTNSTQEIAQLLKIRDRLIAITSIIQRQELALPKAKRLSSLLYEAPPA